MIRQADHQILTRIQQRQQGKRKGLLRTGLDHEAHKLLHFIQVRAVKKAVVPHNARLAVILQLPCVGVVRRKQAQTGKDDEKRLRDSHTLELSQHPCREQQHGRCKDSPQPYCQCRTDGTLF